MRRAEEQARHDPLTGLLNRRGLEGHLEEELRQALETDEFVSVTFFDLDAFKAINDAFGHQVGDQLLHMVGQRLREMVPDEADGWVELYGKKIEELINVLKSKGVPVLWVGLPAIRGQKGTSDMLFLDALYRDGAGTVVHAQFDWRDTGGVMFGAGPSSSTTVTSTAAPAATWMTTGSAPSRRASTGRRRRRSRC